MMLIDAVLIGLPLGCGLLLVLSVVVPRVRPSRLSGAAARVRAFHLAATRWAADRAPRAFPGIRLVTDTRGWLAAEAAVVASAVAAVASGSGPARSAAAVAAALCCGVLLVCLFLRREGRRQLARLRRDLPTAAFLYSLLLESGTGQHAALGQVAASLPPGPLPDQLRELELARAAGLPRAEAYERARSRAPLDDYRLFLDFLAQGERLGTGLAQGLRELSTRMLDDREHEAESTAQKAAVKILVPLVLFIFPSVFLIVLSPVILSIWEALGK